MNQLCSNDDWDNFDNLLNQKNSDIEFDDIFLQTANNTRNTIEAEMEHERWGAPGQYIAK